MKSESKASQCTSTEGTYWKAGKGLAPRSTTRTAGHRLTRQRNRQGGQGLRTRLQLGRPAGAARPAVDTAAAGQREDLRQSRHHDDRREGNGIKTLQRRL